METDHLQVRPSTHLGHGHVCRSLSQASGVHREHQTGVPALQRPTIQQGAWHGLKGGLQNQTSVTKCLESVMVPFFGKGPRQG